MTNPDFVKLANAMGVHALRCTRAEDLGEKMREFLEYDNSKPILLECVVEKAEHVFPMVSMILFLSEFSLMRLCPRFRRVKRCMSSCYILL